MKKRESSTEQVRRWRAANRERQRENSARYYAANKQRLSDYTKQYAREHRAETNARIARWCAANPERARAIKHKWSSANPHKRAAATRRYQLSKRNAVVPLTPHEQAEVIAIYAKARALTELIGEPYHVDHIRPLSKGGLHHPSNLQVLKGIDNLRKGNRT